MIYLSTSALLLLAPQETYRWARCAPPLPTAAMKALGAPLPAAHLADAQQPLTWGEFQVCPALSCIQKQGWLSHFEQQLPLPAAHLANAQQPLTQGESSCPDLRLSGTLTGIQISERDALRI